AVFLHDRNARRDRVVRHQHAGALRGGRLEIAGHDALVVGQRTGDDGRRRARSGDHVRPGPRLRWTLERTLPGDRAHFRGKSLALSLPLQSAVGSRQSTVGITVESDGGRFVMIKYTCAFVGAFFLSASIAGAQPKDYQLFKEVAKSVDRY